MAKRKGNSISVFLDGKIPILDDVIYFIPENVNTINDYTQQKATEQKADALRQLANFADADADEKTENKINEFKDIGFNENEIQERNSDYDIDSDSDGYVDTNDYDYLETNESTFFLDNFNDEIQPEEITNPRFMDSSSFIEIIEEPKNDFIIESLDDDNELISSENDLTSSLFDNNSFVINDLEALADSNDGLESFDFDSIDGAKKPLTVNDDDDDFLDDVKYIKKVNNINNISAEDKDDFSSFMVKMKIREDKK